MLTAVSFPSLRRLFEKRFGWLAGTHTSQWWSYDRWMVPSPGQMPI
jgi:hypothetical protein